MAERRSACRLLTQDFNVYDPTSGTELGSIEGNETIASLFGLTNTEFTVASVDPSAGGTDATLPTVGSVYDVFNLGNGYENVYTAIPSHRRRHRHRHRHAGDAIRRRQPGLAVRLQRRRPAQPR